MFCHKCGGQVGESQTFCVSCGANLASSTASPQTQPQTYKRYPAWFWQSLAAIVALTVLAAIPGLEDTSDWLDAIGGFFGAIFAPTLGGLAILPFLAGVVALAFALALKNKRAPTQVIGQPGSVFYLACKVCGHGELIPKQIYRLSGPAVAIGTSC